ncbi:MAG: hypothetical protein GX643_00595 [Acidimicrobiales bacterium]|nr:hypothetical protein [Acidimicrobiales bacterium]
MDLADLRARRVVLLGLGADNESALPEIVAAEPSQVRLVLDDPHAEQPEPGSLGDSLERIDLEAAAGWGEVFVRAPGFPRYAPALAGVLERGASMTTPLDLWVGTHGADRTLVAVTGTKGKSTVTTMVGHLARAHGLRVGVAGNIGHAVFGDGWDSQAPIVVLEVSSYQAADLHHVPSLVALPFLAQDHVSWHGGVRRYISDKLRVVRNEGGVVAGGVLVAEESGRAVEEIEALGITPVVVPAPSVEREVPAQRVRNAALAAAVVSRLGVDQLTDDEVRATARMSMPGRLDRCDGPGDLFCVDDALASNPNATAAALSWLRGLDRPTIVLLGGQDREVDPAPLAEEAQRWGGAELRAVALPDTGTDLARVCGIPLVAAVETVEEAVAVALTAAGPGTAVLFSPAAATPSRLGNWERRSSDFRSALAAAR